MAAQCQPREMAGALSSRSRCWQIRSLLNARVTDQREVKLDDEEAEATAETSANMPALLLH
jgi:hypothetical protein